MSRVDKPVRTGKGILGRYALVLDAVAAAPQGLSLTETMRATGLPRGTVHRLLNALVEVGYLTHRDGRKVYVIGTRLFRLAHLGIAPAAVASLVRPALERLVARFGETAFLAKLVGDRVESLAMAVPTREGQSHVQPGRIMPIHAAASAKAIFAFHAPDLVGAALALPRTRYTADTHVREEEVRRDLERVREQGYAVCANELDPGVLSYAVPVHLDGAGVVYSVGTVGLSPRLARHPEADVVSALRDAAEEISARIQNGAAPPSRPEASNVLVMGARQ